MSILICVHVWHKYSFIYAIIVIMHLLIDFYILLGSGCALQHLLGSGCTYRKADLDRVACTTRLTWIRLHVPQHRLLDRVCATVGKRT